MAYTRVQFRALIRQRLGWPAADTFVDDSQLNNHINDALAELYSLLATVYRPGQWGVTQQGMTVSAGTYIGNLDAFGDFGRLLKVSLPYANQYIPLQPGDRTVDILNLNPTAWTPYNVKYYLSLADPINEIHFSRPAATDTSVVVYYLRAAPTLAADGSTSWLGWDEYVVLDVMIKCRKAEEADASDLIADKSALQQRIRMQAEPLDMGRAATVQDARALESSYRDGEREWWRR